MSETRAQKIGSPDVGLRFHDRETVSPDSARDELNLAPACRCVPVVKAWGAPPLPLPCHEVALPPSPQCSQFLLALETRQDMLSRGRMRNSRRVAGSGDDLVARFRSLKHMNITKQSSASQVSHRARCGLLG